MSGARLGCVKLFNSIIVKLTRCITNEIKRIHMPNKWETGGYGRSDSQRVAL
jgi:hypothetical protein